MAATTLAASFAAFFARIDDVLAADPGGNTARIRVVFWGQGAPTERGLPLLALQVLSYKRVGVVDNLNEWEARIKMRVVFPVSQDGAFDDCLQYSGQIDDLLDGWLPVVGTEGGEATLWSPTIGAEPGHGREAFIEGETKIRLRTARGAA